MANVQQQQLPPPLSNLHLNHQQEDCLQHQEHKHKLLNHLHHQPMEGGMALHLKSSLEIKARATNSSKNSSSIEYLIKKMKQWYPPTNKQHSPYLLSEDP